MRLLWQCDSERLECEDTTGLYPVCGTLSLDNAITMHSLSVWLPYYGVAVLLPRQVDNAHCTGSKLFACPASVNVESQSRYFTTGEPVDLAPLTYF
jgi:hypothetical protein